MEKITSSFKISPQFNYLFDIALNFLENNKFTFNNEAIYKIDLTGARKTAKTYSVYIVILFLLLHYPKKYNDKKQSGLIVNVFRYYSHHAKESFREFKNICKKFGFDFDSETYSTLTRANKTELSIRFRLRHIVNGKLIDIDNLINFYSINKTDKRQVALTGKARAHNYIGEIRFIDEISQFPDSSDLMAIAEGCGGSAELLEITATNPWSILHWHIRDVNLFLPYDLEYVKIHTYQTRASENRIVHHNTCFSNAFLEEHDKRQLMNTLRYNPIRALTTVYGQPGNEMGAIFGEYCEHLLLETKLQYENDNDFIIRMLRTYAVEKVVFGVDYGMKNDPTVCLCVGLGEFNDITQHYNKIVVFWEYYQSNKDLTYENKKKNIEMAREIYEKIIWFGNVIHDAGGQLFHPDASIPIYIDASANSFLQVLTEHIDNNYIPGWNLLVKESQRWKTDYGQTDAFKYNSVKQAILEIQRLMEQECIVLLKPFTSYLYHEFTTWGWKINTTSCIDKPEDKNNHCIDAFKYALSEDFLLLGNSDIS